MINAPMSNQLKATKNNLHTQLTSPASLEFCPLDSFSVGGRSGMNQTVKKIESRPLTILKIRITKEKLTAEISDGRIISIPLAWFPRLTKATPKQLQNFEISPSGYGIHWPDLDEDIS